MHVSMRVLFEREEIMRVFFWTYCIIIKTKFTVKRITPQWSEGEGLIICDTISNNSKLSRLEFITESVHFIYSWPLCWFLWIVYSMPKSLIHKEVGFPHARQTSFIQIPYPLSHANKTLLSTFRICTLQIVPFAFSAWVNDHVSLLLCLE